MAERYRLKRKLPGRPRGSVKNVASYARKKTLAELAITYTNSAIETIAKIMVDTKVEPAQRLRAAGMLLERGYGRPPQGHFPMVPDKPALMELDEALLNNMPAEKLAALEAFIGAMRQGNVDEFFAQEDESDADEYAKLIEHDPGSPPVNGKAH